jgi:serine/threonine protein kinase
MHAADAIKTPHVVRYIAVGRFPYPLGKGCPEFLTLIMKQEDMKLEQFLQDLEDLDEVQYAIRTRALYKQLIKAYQAIHDAGIIHLDVKPDNTLLSYNQLGEPEIKVCDFGFSAFQTDFNRTIQVSSLIQVFPVSALP